MKRIRILYEGISANLGGIETFIYNLYKKINKEKFEISFLIDKGLKIAYQEEYEKDGCKFYEIENRKKNYFKYLKELKQVYQNNNFDIIHINIMSYSLFERIIYACKYSKAKVIIHSHNGGFSKDCAYKKTMLLDKIGRLFIKKYNNKLIKIACGEKAGKFAFKNNKFEIFNNGIDIDKFRFSELNRKLIRNELKISGKETVLGLIGMFNNPKNHTFLIDIFNEYKKMDNNSKLILIGDGYLRNEIKEKVHKLNLDDSVLFLGKRYDVERLYSAMDIYVMPSLYEGLSISLCEAQINGLKCYTSDDVDKDSNITGNVKFISLKETAETWAKEIFSLDNKRDSDALQKIPDNFNSEVSYKKLSEFYENVRCNN